MSASGSGPTVGTLFVSASVCAACAVCGQLPYVPEHEYRIWRVVQLYNTKNSAVLAALGGVSPTYANEPISVLGGWATRNPLGPIRNPSNVPLKLPRLVAPSPCTSVAPDRLVASHDSRFAPAVDSVRSRSPRLQSAAGSSATACAVAAASA